MTQVIYSIPALVSENIGIAGYTGLAAFLRSSGSVLSGFPMVRQYIVPGPAGVILGSAPQGVFDHFMFAARGALFGVLADYALRIGSQVILGRTRPALYTGASKLAPWQAAAVTGASAALIGAVAARVIG